MWNSRQSQLLLIRISQGGFRRFVLPVPIFVLDLTLSAFSDLACIIDSVAPQALGRARQFRLGMSGGEKMSVESMLQACVELFREMRKYGRWRVVEVQADKVRVFIDFY